MDYSLSKISKLASGAERILFVEEGIKNGGYSMLTERELKRMKEFENTVIDIAAIDDNFASPNEKCDLYDYVGLSPQKLAKKIQEM